MSCWGAFKYLLKEHFRVDYCKVEVDAMAAARRVTDREYSSVGATIHALHAMRATANAYMRVAQPAFHRFQELSALQHSAGILRRNGERAPPVLSA